MPVGHMAAGDALLLLWVPANRLHLGLDVMAAWGFTFRTSGCWVKPRAGTGNGCALSMSCTCSAVVVDSLRRWPGR